MTTVGPFEAQNLLPQLLARVAQGEEILITEGGKPVAKLIPSPAPEQPDVRKVIEEFKAYSSRQARTLGDLTFREMIDEGRRRQPRRGSGLDCRLRQPVERRLGLAREPVVSGPLGQCPQDLPRCRGAGVFQGCHGAQQSQPLRTAVGDG